MQQVSEKIKEDWHRIAISDVCENLDNKRIPITKDRREKGSVPYYGATGIVDYVKDFIFDERLLLVGEDGADWSPFANTAYLINGKSWVNNHAHVLRCPNIDPVFLKEVINRLDLRVYTGGTTRGKLTKESLMNLNFYAPPLREQKKIAEILSKVDEDIEKTDKVIRQTEKLKTGLAEKLLNNKSWRKEKIGNLCEVITGGTPSTRVKEYWGGDTRWMSSGEINLRRVKEVGKRITKEGLNSSNARLLPKGTVMIALAGQGKTRGKVAILEVETTCNQSLAGMIPKDSRLLNEFLFHNLDSRYKEIRNINGSDGRAGLNLTLIKNILTPIPSSEEQKKMASAFSSFDKKIDIYKKIKSQLGLLKRGLMQDLLY